MSPFAHAGARNRTRLGTTLIEVLVVIVIFLVGILAIAQIFPGGIKVLNRTRNDNMALALSRAQLETMKARPDAMPEAVVPIDYVLVGGTYVPQVNVDVRPKDYAPAVTGINALGIAVEAGRSWQLVSGPNRIRRVIAETHKIPTPRFLSPDNSTAADYGSLVQLQFGPIDHNLGQPINAAALQVYGRDMARVDAQREGIAIREYEYILKGASTPAAQLELPAYGPGTFRIAFNAFVTNGGNTLQKSFAGIPYTVTPSGGIETVTVQSLLPMGDTLVSIAPGSIRIARMFRPLAPADPFDPNEPFSYKLYNGRIGHLLINPALFNRYEERPGTTRQQYVARVDYDVRDWRVLREDIRISASNPAGLSKVIKLAIPSLKTNTVVGPDGIAAPSHAEILAGTDAPNAGMEDVFVVSNAAVAGANEAALDNFLMIDAETGTQYLESFNGRPTMKLDKNTGTLTIFDIDNNDANGLTQALALPSGTVVPTNVTNRVARCYYMGREEWAVQLTRNSARYDHSFGLPGVGQFYVGGTAAIGGLPTRVYFPRMDTDRSVVLGKVRVQYDDSGTPRERTLEGVELQIKQRSGDGLATPLPSIDIRDIEPNALGFSSDDGTTTGPAYSITDVRGVSMISKVFYNSSKFALTPNPATNLNQGFNLWAREWSTRTKETYLHRGEAIQ